MDDSELDQSKGPGFWKMNCSILEDVDYEHEISCLLPQWVAEGQNDLHDDRIIWEWLKFKIRAHAVQFSKRSARGRKDTEVQLENEYAEAKRRYDSNCSDINLEVLIAAKEKMKWW